MGHVVARQGAVAGESPGVLVLDSSSARRIGGHDHGKIEVNQTAVIDAVSLAAVGSVGVMTNAARRSDVDDVPAVQRKTFVVENAFPAVATVAQGVGFGRFRGEIAGVVIAYEQRGEERPMRTVRPGPAGGTGVVAVVAVDAGNHAARAKRGDQTDHVRVSPRSRHRMEGRVRGLELEPCVGLTDLPRSAKTRSLDAVAVALKANLVEKRGIVDLTTGDVDAGHAQIRPFDGLPERAAHDADRVMFHGMGVVAVHALDVSPHGEGDFGGIMDPPPISSVMSRPLPDLCGDVVARHRPTVTVQAVVLLSRKAQKALSLRGGMNLVAHQTPVLRYGGVFKLLRGIDGATGRRFTADGVGGVVPTFHVMASDANGRHLIGYPQEIS